MNIKPKIADRHIRGFCCIVITYRCVKNRKVITGGIRMIKKLIAGVLICTIMCGQAIAGLAAWDGYKESGGNEGAGDLVVVDMNNIGSIFNSGAVPSSKIKKNANYSCAWSDMVGVKDIQFKNVPRDWSGCDTVVLNIYSEKATNTDFIFAIWCDLVPIAGAKNSYYSYKITINWEGWKTFEISLKNDFSRSNLAELDAVNYVRITNNGWNCTASEEAAVYFDTIVVKRDGVTEEEETTDMAVDIPYKAEDMAKFTDLAGNAVSVVEYSRNVFTGGKSQKMDENNPYIKITVKDDEAYAPTIFFSKYFGKEVPSDTETFSENGVTYVNLLETAKKLGIPAKEYTNLYVLGEKADFEGLETNENARIAGAYAVCDIENFVVSDKAYKEIKERWLYDIVGDTNNDMTDELVKKTIESLYDKGQTAWDAFRSNEDNPSLLFSAVSTTAHMTQQYEFIAAMAKAYGTKGSKLYKNKKLKKDIVTALDKGYELYYGDDEMKNLGWRDVGLYNWWDWGVGVPMYLLDAIMIISEEVSQEQIDKWIEPIYVMTDSQVKTSESRGSQSMMASALGLSVLSKDSEIFKNTIWYLDEMLRFTKPRTLGVDGLKEDGTYIMHNDFTYNAGYGVSLLGERGMGTLSSFAETNVEIPSPNLSNLLMSVYEVFEPVSYGGAFMSPFIGRSVGKENINGMIPHLIDIIGIFGAEHDFNIKYYIKRNITDGNKGTLATSLGVKQAKILSEILNDTTIPSENNYERAKMYHNGDKAVWHANGYAAALSMHSERQAAWESINDMNKDGWYTSDGALYVYTDSTYMPYGGGWWAAKNPYHIPGTTVDTQERQKISVEHTEDYINSQDFVGGVELSGKYMTAAMSLESFHNEKDTGKKDTGYGAGMPLHDCSLTAKKAYFFFDDEIVAMGSDINAEDGFDVHTVVENRKLTKKGINNGMTELKVKSLSSAGDDGNVVANVQDDNLDTRWSLAGTEDCWFVAELEKASEISHVGLAFYNATNGNAAIFDLEISMDGENWEKVYSGRSNGVNSQMEAFPMQNKTAKYIRYNGHGRVSSIWNSVTEFKVYPPSADGSMKVAFSDGDDSIYGTEDVIIDGQLMEKVNTYDREFENVKYAYIEGFGGYFFNTPDKLFVKKTGSFNNFLEMWLSHGVSPKNEMYAYTLLPDKTSEETVKYSQSPDVQILQNTDKLQAVRENKLGVTGMVFWESGSFDKISSDKPVIVMMQEKNGEVILSVCDPTGKLEKAEITVAGNYSKISADEKISVTSDISKTVANVDFTGSNGRSMEITLKTN